MRKLNSKYLELLHSACYIFRFAPPSDRKPRETHSSPAHSTRDVPTNITNVNKLANSRLSRDMGDGAEELEDDGADDALEEDAVVFEAPEAVGFDDEAELG